MFLTLSRLARLLVSVRKRSKGKGLPQQAEVTQGVPGRLRPRIFLAFRHYKGGRSSAIRTGRLYPRRNPWYSLSEAESTSGHMVLSGGPRKKSPVTPPGIDLGNVRLLTQRRKRRVYLIYSLYAKIVCLLRCYLMPTNQTRPVNNLSFVTFGRRKVTISRS